jgi:uncharacterized protein DUF5753/helix-turn-helix protein
VTPALAENRLTDAGRGPTALRIQLGAHLRRLRQARDLTREAAGYEIRASESKISRMELGRVACKVRDVADLLAFYGAPESEREILLTLARQANSPGWWQSLNDVVPPWFTSYLGLEQAAALIRSYEPLFVPPLLQTCDYARALIRISHPRASSAEVERRVQLRRGRQRILRDPVGSVFWAVLDEGALVRPVGGSRVMRDQLTALIEASRWPNVRLQITSLQAEVLATAGSAFSILRFEEAELPDLVYAEQPTTALYLDRPGDVEHYTVAMERACASAEPPDRTAHHLEQIRTTIP